MFITTALLMGTAHFASERRRLFCAGTQLLLRWLVMLMSVSVPQVCGSYANFELRISSFSNPYNLQKNAMCCDGSSPIWSVSPACARWCNTSLLVCVGSYNSNSYSNWYPVRHDDEDQCSFAYGQLGPFGSSTVLKANISLALRSIPSAFSFQIVAWNVINSSISSSKQLIAAYYVNDDSVRTSTWQTKSLSDSAGNIPVDVATKISFSYTLQCAVNFYGAQCSKHCNPRNDSFGHYSCLSNGTQLCLPGWHGPKCTLALCSAGCHPVSGSCSQPFTCQCQPGWSGPNCSDCIPYPGCSAAHGYCITPYDCFCKSGWGGEFCDQDFSFCQNEPCANGGTCRRNYTAVEKPNATSLSTYYWYSCQCAPGFAGNNCQTQLQSWTQNCSKQQTALCLNGATCLVNMTRAAETESKVVCTCPPGFSGLFCSNDDSVCSPNPCLNGGTCTAVNTSATCTCLAGYSGARCEQAAATSNANVNGNAISKATKTKTRTTATANRHVTTSADVGLCGLQPCINFQTCVFRGGMNFDCVCEPPYSGEQCDQVGNGASQSDSTAAEAAAATTISSVTMLVIIIMGIVFPCVTIVVVSVVLWKWIKRKHRRSPAKKTVEEEADEGHRLQSAEQHSFGPYSMNVQLNNLDGVCFAAHDCNQLNENIAQQLAAAAQPRCSECVGVQRVAGKYSADVNLEMPQQKTIVKRVELPSANADESTAYRSSSCKTTSAQSSSDFDNKSLSASAASVNTNSLNLSPRFCSRLECNSPSSCSIRTASRQTSTPCSKQKQQVQPTKFRAVSVRTATAEKGRERIWNARDYEHEPDSSLAQTIIYTRQSFV